MTTGAEILPGSPLYLQYNALWSAVGVEPNAIEGSRNEDAFTPQFVVQWDATEDVMLYASYVEGFKSGGYNIRAQAAAVPLIAARLPGDGRILRPS